MLEQFEGGCHCGRVRSGRKSIWHCCHSAAARSAKRAFFTCRPHRTCVPDLLRGKNALIYTFGSARRGPARLLLALRHARVYVYRASQPDRIRQCALSRRHRRASLKPTRFFDGRHWEEAQRQPLPREATRPPPV
jgi:hypothetical protein